jgi:hypothetical protein
MHLFPSFQDGIALIEWVQEQDRLKEVAKKEIRVKRREEHVLSPPFARSSSRTDTMP